MENKLRGLVLSKFRSITAFAEAMHWNRKKASQIVNHTRVPYVDDLYRMADMFGVMDADSFVQIFLPELTTKWGK